MGTFKCYWPGGLLDVYRHACLASYEPNGHRIELYGSSHPAALPAGVKPRPLTPTMQADFLNHHLISATEATPQAGSWIPLDLLCLQPLSVPSSTPNNPLAWIEAFKLWLPEYNDELRQRARHWVQLPLHLSFAAMAGLDHHCLPPQGSFLADVLTRQAKAADALPRPHYEAQAVRQQIRQLLLENHMWTVAPLGQHCGQAILKELGLISAPPFSLRLKRRIKNLLLGLKRQPNQLPTN